VSGSRRCCLPHPVGSRAPRLGELANHVRDRHQPRRVFLEVHPDQLTVPEVIELEEFSTRWPAFGVQSSGKSQDDVLRMDKRLVDEVPVMLLEARGCSGQVHTEPVVDHDQALRWGGCLDRFPQISLPQLPGLVLHTLLPFCLSDR